MSKIQRNLGRGLGDLIGEVSQVRAMPNRAPAAPAPSATPPPPEPAITPGRNFPMIPLLLGLAVCACAVLGFLLWKKPPPEVVERIVEKEVRVEVPAPPPPRDARGDWALQPGLDGLHVQPLGSSTRWIFKQPVFQSRDELSADAEKRLALVARLFLPHAASCVIQVDGHTDEVPARPGADGAESIELGYRRALAAARVLRKAGVPTAAIRLGSPGVSQAPYPNTSEEGRRLNRTVTVTIRPAS